IPRYDDAQARISYEIAKDERTEVTWLHSSDDVNRVASSADPLLRKQDERSVSFERVYARYEKGAVSVVPWFGVDHSRRLDRFGAIPASLEQHTTLYGLRAAYRGNLTKVLSMNAGLD